MISDQCNNRQNICGSSNMLNNDSASLGPQARWPKSLTIWKTQTAFTQSKGWCGHGSKTWQWWLNWLWMHRIFGIVAKEHSLSLHPTWACSLVNSSPSNLTCLFIQPLYECGPLHLFSQPKWRCLLLCFEAAPVFLLRPGLHPWTHILTITYPARRNAICTWDHI